MIFLCSDTFVNVIRTCGRVAVRSLPGAERGAGDRFPPLRLARVRSYPKQPSAGGRPAVASRPPSRKELLDCAPAAPRRPRRDVMWSASDQMCNFWNTHPAIGCCWSHWRIYANMDLIWIILAVTFLHLLGGWSRRFLGQTNRRNTLIEFFPCRWRIGGLCRHYPINCFQEWTDKACIFSEAAVKMGESRRSSSMPPIPSNKRPSCDLKTVLYTVNLKVNFPALVFSAFCYQHERNDTGARCKELYQSQPNLTFHA